MVAMAWQVNASCLWVGVPEGSAQPLLHSLLCFWLRPPVVAVTGQSSWSVDLELGPPLLTLSQHTPGALVGHVTTQPVVRPERDKLQIDINPVSYWPW